MYQMVWGEERERETRGRPSYLLFVSIRSLIQNGAGSETCGLVFSACSQIACVPVEYLSGFTKEEIRLVWFELRLGLGKASEARIKSTMCVWMLVGWLVLGAWCLVLGAMELEGLEERGSLCRFRFEPRTSPRSPSSGGREGGAWFGSGRQLLGWKGKGRCFRAFQ
jgi:hypothetical protein